MNSTIDPRVTCGCGKPTRYMVGENTFACNKYFRCSGTYKPEEQFDNFRRVVRDSDRYRKLKEMLSMADSVEKLLIASSENLDSLIDNTNMDK